MKISHVITTIHRGGAENQLLILAKEQIVQGFEVEVIFLKDEPQLMDLFRQNGVQVNEFLAQRNPLSQALRLSIYLKKRPDRIVHAHLPRAELVTKLFRIRNKYFYSRHNAEAFFPGAPAHISRFLSLYATRGKSNGIAISNAVKNFIEENHELMPSKEMKVIYYGIDDSVNPPSDSERPFQFGTVARHVPQKNLELLLSSFARIYSNNRSSNLLMVGSGPLTAHLKKYSVELGISDAITWISESDDIPSLMTNIDIFILPSLYEGFGLVILEAIQNGCVVLASKISALPEVLGSSYGGLFDPLSKSELEELMKMSLDSSDFRLKLRNESNSRLKIFNSRLMSINISNYYSSFSS